MFAEVELCTSCKTINTMAKIDLVSIEGENLRFGEMPFDLYGQHYLVELATVGAHWRQK